MSARHRRNIDEIGTSAYRSLSRKYTLVPKQQVAAWKAYGLIAFVAGIAAASIWLTSTHFRDDEIVINTKSFSQARSEAGINSLDQGGVVGRADDRILVKFKKDVSSTKRQDILKKHGLKEKSELKQVGVKIVSLPTGVTPELAVKKILDEDKIAMEFVEVDALIGPDYTPNDPALSSEWHVAKIGVPTAWDHGKGSGVIIAILDSGTDCTHPDLSANCVAGRNVVSNNSDTTPIHPHGTYTAGTAAAVGDNANQMAGVAYVSKIMPVRITNDSSGWAYWSDIANGVLWAADHGVRVVNNSYGSHVSSTVQSAASYLNSKGGLMFNSAMNDGAAMTQANPSSMITVSATDSNDMKASWSNYGTPIDLAAPGVNVTCTVPNNGISTCSGTSFASPIVAATAALIWSINPSLTSGQVEGILQTTALDLGAAGRDDSYGYGRVDAAAAVAAARNTETDTLPPTPPSNLVATTMSSQVALTWTAATDNFGVANYLVLRDNQQIGTTTKTTYTDTSISPTASYSYSVKAVDAAQNTSGISNVVTVTIPIAPLTLTSVTSKVTSASTATIAWTTSSPAANSVLRYGLSQSVLNTLITDSTAQTSYEAKLIGLLRKTRYYYQVSVTGPNGEVVTSNVQSFLTRTK